MYIGFSLFFNSDILLIFISSKHIDATAVAIFVAYSHSMVTGVLIYHSVHVTLSPQGIQSSLAESTSKQDIFWAQQDTVSLHLELGYSA